MTSLRYRELVFISFAFAAYLFIQILSTLTGRPCKNLSLPHSSELYFENDVVLEFEKYGFECSQNSSKCLEWIEKNSTRIVLNGKVWTGKERFENLDLDLNGVAEQKPKELPPQKNGPKLVLEKISDKEGVQNIQLLSCNEIDRLFRPILHGRTTTENGINIIHGSINHPQLGTTFCIQKEAFKETRNSGFNTLMKEREKRLLLGPNTAITHRLLGDCVALNNVSIIVEYDKSDTELCEEDAVANYAHSKCYKNEMLTHLIDEAPDKTRAAFAFIKNLLCLFAEVERNGYFVKDIHGKHLSVSSNFSVHVNNIDNLSHHGSRNILSGSTCKYDENCPKPTGNLWANGSANQIVYEKCTDPIPLCSGTSCAGYNASLHLCGISRWILQPLYSYFVRVQDRSRMTSIMMSSMNGWPFLRKSTTDACKKAVVYLNLYDKDMKLSKDNNKVQRKSFHLR